VKLQAAQIERFLQQPDPRTPVVLLFGPDEGLIRERAIRLLGTVLEDPNDPFRLSEFQGDQIRSDPALLADEARALCLVGGRRVVRVRQGGDLVTAATKTLLALDGIEALVLIEGGDLAVGSSLRKLIEKAPKAAAIGCYRDDGRDLAATIDQELARHRLKLEPEARAYLLEHLGGDRGVTKAELAKLVLYAAHEDDDGASAGDGGAAPPAVLGLDAVAAVIGDSAALGLDDLAFAATAADARQVERCLNRLLGEGQAPVRLLRTLINHLVRLRRMALQVAGGQTPEQVIAQVRPMVHFRRKSAVRTALRQWPAGRLDRALAGLLQAEIACKSTGRPAALLCREAIFRLCHAERLAGR
jgi:DNA polymerase-3 subunit delta